MSAADASRAPSPRTPSRVRADIADLERLLVDVPPHHASGTRRSLDEQLEDLRSELRRLEGRA
jgi:molybdate-binding protein